MPVDFKVKWMGSEKATSDEIIVNWIFKRLKAGLPVTIIIYGKSRTGKSRYMLKIQDKLYKKFGVDFAELLPQIVLIKPEDWSSKAREVFEQKTEIGKMAKSIHMDEAKFLLNAKDWQKLKNRTITTIAATSGAIKPILFIVVGQLLKDFDSNTRQTADLIMECKRSPGNKSSIKVTIPYEKVVDLSTIKIKPRAFNGNIVYPDGTSEHVLPVFRPTLPRREVEKAYQGFEKGDKAKQIFDLFDNLDKETAKLRDDDRNKLQETAEYLVEHKDELEKISVFKRNRYKLGLAARKRFDSFSEREIMRLQDLINTGLKEKAEEKILIKKGVIE